MFIVWNFVKAAAWSLIPVFVVGASTFFPALARDHTISKSVHAQHQTAVRNAYWQALVFDRPIANPELDDLRRATVQKLRTKNPAGEIYGSYVQPGQWPDVNGLLGIEVVHHPVTGQTTQKYGYLSSLYAVYAVQANRQDYRSIIDPIPLKKTPGNLSWRMAEDATGGTFLAFLLVIFFSMIGSDVRDSIEARNKRNAQIRKDHEYLESLGPRARQVELTRREISRWPASPEKDEALKKCDDASRIVRQELTAESQVKLNDINRELTGLIEESKTWQKTYRELSE